jgi:hypothetical protein
VGGGDAVVDRVVGDEVVDYTLGVGFWFAAHGEGSGPSVAGLQDVEGTAHVAFGEVDEGVDGGGVDVDLFAEDDVVDEFADVGFF